MYLRINAKLIFILVLVSILKIQNSTGLENRILFKVDNEIITTVDIYEEIKFLKTFNPEMESLSDAELYEISKNSIIRDKIKKIEIMNFVEKLEVNDEYFIRLIKAKFSNKGIDSLEKFEDYLKKSDIDINIIREKFTIELIWNDIIYQKFSNKIVIDREKIKKELSQNPQKEFKKNFCFQK